MLPHLNNHHRDTLEQIFAHPTSANIEWRQVESLLDALGTAESHGNKLRIRLGAEPELVLDREGKDLSIETVVALRRLLESAGFAPDAGG